MTPAVAAALEAAGREVAAAHRPRWPPVVRWAPIDAKLEVAVLEGEEVEALEAIAAWRHWWLAMGPAWDDWNGHQDGNRAATRAVERRQRKLAEEAQLRFDLGEAR
jgi:hypothetical protein